LKRIQRPTLPPLASTELHIDVASDSATAVRIANQSDKLPQSLTHATANPPTEVPLERTGVAGYIFGYRGENFGSYGIELGLDYVRDLWWQSPGPLLRRRICHLSHNKVP
jgi:hypothetical protein